MDNGSSVGEKLLLLDLKSTKEVGTSSPFYEPCQVLISREVINEKNVATIMLINEHSIKLPSKYTYQYF